jgi:hypothetical protein
VRTFVNVVDVVDISEGLMLACSFAVDSSHRTTSHMTELPVLVECEPYHAKLMKSACVDRWVKAQTIVSSGKGLKRGTSAKINADRRSALAYCARCKVGEERKEDD